MDEVIPVKCEHLKGLPFKLKSRHGIAIVFSFYGDSDEVGQFMQKASHKTRSYYVNANRFKNFVVSSVFIVVLKREEAKQKLDKLT